MRISKEKVKFAKGTNDHSQLKYSGFSRLFSACSRTL